MNQPKPNLTFNYGGNYWPITSPPLRTKKRKEFAQDLIDGIDLHLDEQAWAEVEAQRDNLHAYLAALEAYVTGPTTRRPDAG